MRIVNETDEGLVEILLSYNFFFQKGDESLERKDALHILLGVDVSVHTDVGKEIQILDEVSPMPLLLLFLMPLLNEPLTVLVQLR